MFGDGIICHVLVGRVDRECPLAHGGALGHVYENILPLPLVLRHLVRRADGVGDSIGDSDHGRRGFSKHLILFPYLPLQRLRRLATYDIPPQEEWAETAQVKARRRTLAKTHLPSKGCARQARAQEKNASSVRKHARAAGCI